MKTLGLFLSILGFLFLSSEALTQGTAINTTGSAAHTSAMLDVESTTMGMLIPRMSLANRTAISSPATGLMIYQTDNTPGFYYYDGSNWKLIGSGAFAIDDLSDGISDGSSIFLGSGAGTNDNESNNQNVAVGIDALHANTTGYANTATGYQTLYSNTTGDKNTAYGYFSLKLNTGYNNTAVGTWSLQSNIGGGSNSALGVSSLTQNTTGWYNSALGKSSLYWNTTGSSNNAIGDMALMSNTTGNGNIGIGNESNRLNQTGDYNIVIGYNAGRGTSDHNKSGNVILGYQAGYNVTTGSDANVFIGYQAGYSETGANKLYIENTNSTSPLIYGEFDTDLVRINGDLDVTGSILNIFIDDLSDGKTDDLSVFLGSGAGAVDDGNNSNVAVGVEALNANTSGLRNTATGYRTLYFNTEGRWNTATGCYALLYNTTGEKNTANGNGTLWSNTTGSNNTVNGHDAYYYNETGSNNTIIGYEAGKGTSDKSQSNNVFLGYQAGFSVTTGSDANIFLGYQAGYSEAGSNKLYIENSNSTTPLIYGDFATDKVTINNVLKLTPRALAPTPAENGDLYVGTDHHIYCRLDGVWVQLD